jgi:hypothetical protein
VITAHPRRGPTTTCDPIPSRPRAGACRRMAGARSARAHRPSRARGLYPASTLAGAAHPPPKSPSEIVKRDQLVLVDRLSSAPCPRWGRKARSDRRASARGGSKPAHSTGDHRAGRRIA